MPKGRIRITRGLQWRLKDGSSRDHERRPFHESQKQQNRLDASSIDFAYMPQHTLEEAMPPEVIRTPLLPHNFFPPRTTEGSQGVVESVVRPEISTVSANSTHIESPSAMSEVTDNHAIEIDPYNLTSKVTVAAAKIAEVPTREAGVMRELWDGLLDDLFGPRRVSKV
ncbi:MAG: hypothetical protein L6R37_002790 [Teloschistes peruensis]|nr:MAG: hypothetical protein L6R37_002790 [Teloschistes peruensis]